MLGLMNGASNGRGVEQRGTAEQQAEDRLLRPLLPFVTGKASAAVFGGARMAIMLDRMVMLGHKAYFYTNGKNVDNHKKECP